jgi:hypothetical protein|tara:strand:+ start:12596 stop:13771 length:1176 start_codon:yes stop_codon:yes gene_type:complete
MIRLLLIRALPLFFRPAAIIAEAILLHGSDVLVIVLPVASLALSISSVPVHVDFYRSSAGDKEHANRGRDYASAVTAVLLIGLFSIVVLLLALPFASGALVVAAIAVTFGVEKIADEVSRALEFQKNFLSWFWVQVIRSIWLLLPIVVARVSSMDYEVAFVCFSMLAFLGFWVLFYFVTGLSLGMGLRGYTLVRDKLPFLLGNALPGIYRQLPRVLVSSMFPQYAHSFLAVAQVCQGAGLLYNVRFQIPFRKVIAHRTRLFQARMRPLMAKYVLIIFATALTYLFAGFVAPHVEPVVLAILLVPLLLADAVFFSILSATVGYVAWSSQTEVAVLTFAICLLVIVGSLGILAAAFVSTQLSVVQIPAVAIIIGVSCLAIINARHFPKACPNK